jgi:hypothetical protein
MSITLARGSQSRIRTAIAPTRWPGGRGRRAAVMGPAETLSDDGLAFLLVSGPSCATETATGSRRWRCVPRLQPPPRREAGCPELVARQGVALPDTPVIAAPRAHRPPGGTPAPRPRPVARSPVAPRDLAAELGCHADDRWRCTGRSRRDPAPPVRRLRRAGDRTLAARARRRARRARRARRGRLRRAHAALRQSKSQPHVTDPARTPVRAAPARA